MRRPWLAPLVPVYAAGLAWRNLRLRQGQTVRHLRRAVISVGNLSVGGSGKTPLTIALAKMLTARGVAVDVLSRGYGRLGFEPVRVDPHGTAEQFGDEPVLIARRAEVPVYVAAQRYDAGVLAEASAEPEPGASQDKASDAEPRLCAHILDDGFQHRQLSRVVDILLIDRADLGDSLLPGGNLREPLAAAKRASVIAIPAEDPALDEDLSKWGWTGPVWRLRRLIELPVFHGPALAFCGIARPEQFFSSVAAAGACLTRHIAFPDHHRFTAKDIRKLDIAVLRSGARVLLTTEKDLVRMGKLQSARPLLTARLTIEIEDEQGAAEWLIKRLSEAPSH
jgi:tetraacyldisaccharide 4'-kinase